MSAEGLMNAIFGHRKNDKKDLNTGFFD